MATSLNDNLPEVLKRVRTQPLLVMRLDVRKLLIVGATPGAYRRIGVVPGGSFEGDKRYQPESFAGSTRTWGIDNRTVMLRVINSSAGSCRVENRLGGADLNPYVAFACCLGAGIRGMRK